MGEIPSYGNIRVQSAGDVSEVADGPRHELRDGLCSVFFRGHPPLDPQPPFSTKKVRKIKKIKFKLAFERATSIISNRASRGAVGEVKGRPFRR